MKNIFWVILVVGMVAVSACGAKPAEDMQVVEAEEETVGITVKDVVFSKSLGEYMEPAEPTESFLPPEPINASVVIDGRPKSGIVTGNFYYGD